jgi:mono/diheme cytochrome c family protein
MRDQRGSSLRSSGSPPVSAPCRRRASERVDEPRDLLEVQQHVAPSAASVVLLRHAVRQRRLQRSVTESAQVAQRGSGRGDGAAAYLLSPAPRDFGSARFRIVSTVNQVPTEADLVAVLRRGMPGSAMPPWEWMPDSDLLALAGYVRELAIAGRADDLQKRAEAEQETLERTEAVAIATHALTPGNPIPVPPDCAGTPAELQAGRRFFVENCSKCHGAEGTGTADSPQVNEDGTPAYPRDFTRGILKGGSSHADIVRRITAGLPGSPMPATEIKDPVLAACVSAYVRSLIRPGMQERVAQTRRTLVAQRAAGTLPQAARDAAWSQAPEQWVPLMPLWARAHGVEGCTIRALHDGTTLALRISWEDRTQSTELLAQDLFTDAVALQWSRGAQPPLFTMGEPTRPVNIWQWPIRWRISEPRLGAALPQPVRLRPRVLLGLRAQRHPQLPHHRARPQRRHRAAGRAIRRSHLHGPLRQARVRRWGNRHCAKGYTFHRILYGPYRLKHPIVRRGWKRWADDGFPTSRGGEGEVQIRHARHGQVRAHLVGRGLRYIAKAYEGHRHPLQRRGGREAARIAGLSRRR